MKMSTLLGIVGYSCQWLYGQAIEVQEIELQQFYVEPSQLTFSKRGIFAFVDGQWIGVNEIHV